MIHCQDFQADLFEFVSGELSLGRHRELEGHLSECHECASELVAYRRIMYLGQRLRTFSPPQGLLHRFCQAAAQEPVEHTEGPLGK